MYSYHHETLTNNLPTKYFSFRDNVVVRTYYGDVEGFSIPWHIDDETWDPNEGEYPQWFMRRINCFLGVPYASPPVGRLRFRVRFYKI